MHKLHKGMVATLVVGSLFAYSLPVLADSSTGTQIPPTTTVQTGQTQAVPATPPSNQASPTDKATARKQQLETEIQNVEKAQQFQQYMAPIHQLQTQAQQVRSQINSSRQSISAQIKTDRQAKNYPALLAALNDMIPMQDDIAAAEQTAQSAKTDWQQFKTDNQAQNSQGIAADLQKLQSDIQNRITVYQKILTDLQKINSDLGQSSAAPASNGSASSTTPATSGSNT